MILSRFRSVFIILFVCLLLIVSCNNDTDNQAESVSESFGDDVYLLPSDEQLISLTMISDPLQLVSEEMPELIGDLFEDFESYGIISMVMADYVDDPGKNQYVVELYRFPDSRLAFGLYSFLRMSHLEILPLGTQGFIKPNQLCFLKDRFVVCVSGNENSVNCRKNLMKLGRVANANISGIFEFPEEFAVFPLEMMIENSERFFAEDFLFRGNAVPSFSAKYNIGQTKATAFYVPVDGLACLSSYLRHIIENGKVIEEYQSQGLLRYYIIDPLHGNVILYAKEDRCIGAMGSIDFTQYPEFMNSLLAVVD
jgi:Family of unknown function (DUF6599)